MSIKNPYKNFIAHIQRHVDLTEDDIDKILSRSHHKTYLKGQYIGQEGEIARTQTFILEGSARTFYLDSKGNEHIFAFGIDDWWVGDITSFTSQTPAEFNVQCLDKCHVVQITYENMEALYEEVPKMERYFRIIVGKAYGSVAKRIVRNHALSAKERYLNFMERYPNIVQRVPQYMIASYLGVTKEFLSSLRKQITKEQKS